MRTVIEPRILRHAEDAERVLADLAAAVRAHFRVSNKPLAAALRFWSPPRNNEQNARLWWMHGLMAAHLNERVPDMIAAGMLPKFFQRFDAEAVHECIFKQRYCGTLEGGRPRSSTRLNKLDFAEALTRYEADMVNEGIEIPENQDEWR